MINQACSNNGRSPFLWLLTIMTAIAIIYVFATAAPTLAHADLRHGSEASIARPCAERPEHIFYNEATKRKAFVCTVLDGKFGVAVLDEVGEEVTAFIKNKMKSYDQVKRYLENCGYKPLN